MNRNPLANLGTLPSGCPALCRARRVPSAGPVATPGPGAHDQTRFAPVSAGTRVPAAESVWLPGLAPRSDDLTPSRPTP